jgi:hypothetical protein
MTKSQKTQRRDPAKRGDNALITTLSRAANSDILYQDTPLTLTQIRSARCAPNAHPFVLYRHWFRSLNPY